MPTSQDKLLRFAEKLARGELTDAIEEGVEGEPWESLAKSLEQVRREWQAERGAAVEQAVRQVTALSDLANRDGLTGLLNRRAMTATLSKVLKRAKSENTPLAVAMLDLDFFKRTNDTYGHSAGDALLRAVSELLRVNIRQGDAACRPGGEEFVLILPGMSMQNAFNRVNVIVSRIRDLRVDYGGQIIRTTVSAGIACFPNDSDDLEQLLRVADAAMYRAKEAGRDRLASPTHVLAEDEGPPQAAD